eukprot:10223604-Alexandrium_andersonii.AAC.1
MKCWVRLVMSVCKTEWPSFDVFAAFDCLALSSSQRHHREDTDISGNDEDIDRLAKAFHVNSHAL